MADRRRGLEAQVKRLARALGIKERRARRAENVPPDFDERTARVFRAVAAYTMTSAERVEALVNAVRYIVANGVAGDIVECGVWRGGSAMAAALTLRELGDERRHLYLYDTFEGMSAPTEEDVTRDGVAAQGKFVERQLSEESSDWCRALLDEVRLNVASTGYPDDRLHFIKGKVEARRCTRSERQTRLLSRKPPLKMREDALDERRVLDARDHLQLAAAAPTRLDLDRKHAFEPLRPRHRDVFRRAARQRHRVRSDYGRRAAHYQRRESRPLRDGTLGRH